MAAVVFVEAALTIALLSAACSYADQIAGPFRVIPDHVEECPKEMLDIPFSIRARGVRDRQRLDVWYYSANFTTSFTYSDFYDGALQFSSWSSRGGWKPNAQKMRFHKLCSIVKVHFPKLLRDINIAVHGDPDADCPYPPGSYSGNNVSSDFGAITLVPAFYYGKWRIEGKVLEPGTDRCMACLRVFVQLVPRYDIVHH